MPSNFKPPTLLLTALLFCLLIIGCSSPITKGEDLNESQIAYIKSLQLLDEGEKIIQFDSQSDFKQSGNFFTDKRIASYWIDDDPDKHSIQFSLFEEVDSLSGHNLKSSLLNASFLEVFLKSGGRFKVYVDSDSGEVSNFFLGAQAQLKKARH